MSGFTPSAARTIPWTGWLAVPEGVTPTPMAFPPKESPDLLDYTVDLSAWLADAGEDTVSAVTVTPLSQVAGDVTINPPLIYSAQHLTAWLEYGQGGASYDLEYAIVTAAGRTANFVVTIAVLDTVPSIPPVQSPPLSPPAPVSWPPP